MSIKDIDIDIVKRRCFPKTKIEIDIILKAKDQVLLNYLLWQDVSIKELRGFYDYHPRFISIKSNNGILSYNKLGRKTRWTSRKDRRKNSDKAGSHINFLKMYFDVDNISNASTEEEFVV